MTSSNLKKEALINSLKKLHLDAMKKVIDTLKQMDFAQEADLNATLTQLIYLSVLVPHARMMDPNYHTSKTLRTFCLKQIGPIKTKRYRHGL